MEFPREFQRADAPPLVNGEEVVLVAVCDGADLVVLEGGEGGQDLENAYFMSCVFPTQVQYHRTAGRKPLGRMGRVGRFGMGCHDLVKIFLIFFLLLLLVSHEMWECRGGGRGSGGERSGDQGTWDVDHVGSVYYHVLLVWRRVPMRPTHIDDHILRLEAKCLNGKHNIAVITIKKGGKGYHH